MSRFEKEPTHNVISYKNRHKRLRTSSILIISNSPAMSAIHNFTSYQPLIAQLKFSLLICSPHLSLFVACFPISLSFPPAPPSFCSFSSSLDLSLSLSLTLTPNPCECEEDRYSHSAVIALVRESMGITSINCEKVISITLISY